MEDEIKTVDASEDVATTEEVKPKRKYTRRKTTEAPAEENKAEAKEETKEEVKEEPVAEVKEEPVVEEVKAEEPAPAPVEEVQEEPKAEEPVEEVPAEPVEEPKEEEPAEEEVKEEPKEEPEEEVKAEEPEVTSKVEDAKPAEEEVKSEKPEKIDVSPEVQVEVMIDWNAAVGKFFITKRQLSIFRAPNSVAKGKPFMGRIQVVDNTNDLFVKVRYVRSGLGATYGYAKKSQIIQTCGEIQ